MQILENSTTRLEQRAREYKERMDPSKTARTEEGIDGGLFLESNKRKVSNQSESTVDNDIEGWESIDPSHL
ncbi:uncharacterized protein N7446_010535 [Penicillium canescens]|uniref:Uncharacterized protein n=1 Tax=Penicillium canescens TaxID=5083 RepID=A0AAD6N8J8_PENCN|nr:uncharacterized protein N7446_010535 [Penicillium canescens]KAJ6041581.1 hypothetical protein N7460_006971 [Penicillium canescens]KAJ6050426.1 hypothetical protein N7446_010535 [Penicillium canescens]KAJ6064730.1 hypothetical protein N7444_000383 [Penicillium canescens]